METIPTTVVEAVWQDQAQLNWEKAQQLAQSFSKEQPVLLAYLLSTNYDTYNQDERELLHYLGFAIWQMMSRGSKKLKPVSEESVEKNQERNYKMVEYFSGESEATLEKTIRLAFENYNQPNVLRYVVEALMEEDDEETEINQANIGLMFLDLKTVIDCLDQ